MNTKTRLLSTAGFACLLTFSARYAGAEPLQLFLDAPAEAVCHLPVDVEILVLNENGELEKDFDGVHALRISVEECGKSDESYTISSRDVKFRKGKASFSVKDSEEETLDMDVTLQGAGVSGRVSLSFVDKDISPPKIVDIFEEAPGILKLEFNEDLEEESAQDVRNYRAVTNKRETFPESIEYHRSYVFLKFEDHFGTDEEGYLELEGIKDPAGNAISSGTKSPDFEGTCEDACGH